MHREWLCKQDTTAGTVLVPRLVPIKNKVINWNWAASTVALTQSARYLSPHEPYTAPILINTAVPCLLNVNHLTLQGQVKTCIAPGLTTSLSMVVLIKQADVPSPSSCSLGFSEEGLRRRSHFANRLFFVSCSPDTQLNS